MAPSIRGRRRLERRVEVLTEALRESMNNEGLLAENLNQLELAISGDVSWRRMVTAMEMDFSRSGLDDLASISRAMYLSHPLIQRAVNVTTYYTWSQGYQFKAKDERIQREVVEPQWSDETNRLEIYSHQAALLTDVDQICDGNIFAALFTDDTGAVQIRSVPSEQIREIITHPQDRLQVWFYRRQWSQNEFDLGTGLSRVKEYEVLYPDIHYQPRRKPESIGGKRVAWDSPMIHQRTGGLKHMQFGLPQTYAALDWARAYKKFLEDWHTVVSSLARFAWKASTKGSKAQRLKRRLTRSGSELSEPTLGGDENGPPVPGAVWSDSSDIVPINKTGAYTSAADAKQSRLMVGAAMDLPDTILSGDPQQGNLATAQTLDRPTELGMRSRQTLWNDFHARIWRYTVDAKVRRGQLPGRVVRTADGSVVDPGIDPTVVCLFPPILEHDPKSMVAAIVSAATLDGKSEAGLIPREELAKQLMKTIGVEDIETALAELGDLENQDMQSAMDRLAKALATAPGDIPAQPEGVNNGNGNAPGN